MSVTKFYPPITNILPVDAIPNELGFIKDGLTSILSHIYFRDLQFSKNDRGDAGFYSLSIVSLKRLDIEIPGTGIYLILNPSHHPTTPDMSDFPVTVAYQWPILGYLRQFNLSTFSFMPGDIFDVALQVIGVTPREVVERALALFVVSPAPLDQFVDDVNTLFGTAIPHADPLSVDPLGDILLAIDNEASIKGAGGAVFALYLLDALSDDSTRDRIKTFFEDFFDGDSIEDYIKRLLIPKINATLEVGLAIEFPRTMLEPLDAIGGEPISDPNIKTWLTFDLGSLFFSTDRGIGFDQMLTATLNYPSRIAGTSLGISLGLAKLDISRTTNIPEADADGRPADFVGVYINDATISFPAFWNHDAGGSTGIIRGRDLLMGTGGFSGTLGLEAISAGTPVPIVKVKFGDDFSISLDAFSITLKQNSIIGSDVQGTLVIPGFKDANDQPAEIRIKIAIRDNGDFDVTAHEDDGFKKIKFGDIFTIDLKSVFFGKKDDDFYLGVSGGIKFTHPLLANIFKDEIEVEKLVIWSDGRFEIEGGTLPLPSNFRFPIGPVEISISALHFGSHQQEGPGGMRNYRYFGFDGGIDINPGGVDVRGKGIKFYYTVDDDPGVGKTPDRYLEIKSISIDLVIPGDATKETATLLISGFLNINGTSTDPEYEGGVSFSLPKAQIAGGASMKYRPKDPSFIVDAFVELSAPIPLGTTGLGIYGFRGLFGHHYVATKHAAGLTDDDTWFNYYKAPPQEGVVVSKFETPAQTAGYDNAFSIGAGVSLATTVDSGHTFSTKLFLLLSIPNLIYLEGKANILGDRVGLTGDDPPFFAYLAISPQSVETGFGADYDLPKESGWILDTYAEIRAAFFFQNASAWYVNFGTDTQPISARVLSLFNATAYVMLSSWGIKGGAGVTWGFDKKYAGGMVRASVRVYISVSGFISFQRPQIGGTAMLGGHVDAYLLFIGFYIGIDTSLSVEAPKPFYIKGSVHLCVGITIGFWKFKKRIEKCFDVEFKWEKDPTVDTTPISPITTLPAMGTPLKGINMLSGESFTIIDFGGSAPSASSSSFNHAVLPLDTWVDMEFVRGFTPDAVVDQVIGRLSGMAPSNNSDLVPPAEVEHKVTHQYSIKAAEIKAWTGSAWVDYHPYQAMATPDALAALNANPADYKDGYWQNTGNGFNKIRLLAETSLSYMQQGQPGWYVPEQFGITSATLFCQTKLREKHCIKWITVPAGTVYADGDWQQMDSILYAVIGGPGTVINWNNPFGIPRSLQFYNEDRVEIVYPKPCVEVDLKLTTFSSGVVIQFLKRVFAGGTTFVVVETRTLTQLQLLSTVQYNNPNEPISKVIIQPVNADPAAVLALQIQIDTIYRDIYENKHSEEEKKKLLELIRQLQEKLTLLLGKACDKDGITKEDIQHQLEILKKDLATWQHQVDVLLPQQQAACAAASDFSIKFKKCFPYVPSRLTHEIYTEHVQEGVGAYRFHVLDSLKGDVLLSGTDKYADAASAEKAMQSALHLAVDKRSYIPIVTEDQKHSFHIADATGNIVAVPGNRLKTKALNNKLMSYTQATLSSVLIGNQFAIPPKAEVTPPCPVCMDHLDCWKILSSTSSPAGGPVFPAGCTDIIDRILQARDRFCKEYAELYYELYNCNKKILDALTAQCETLTAQLNEAQGHVNELNQQIKDLTVLIKWIDKNGPVLPPREFPCSTLLHQACCLSLEDYQFNISIPAQAAIENDYQAAADAASRMLTPIWRPDTKYYIHLKVTDTVNGTAHDMDHYYGFRTAGPVGYFHTAGTPPYADPAKPIDQYTLTSLKGYVDYARSYPNADGELIRAKPLFYEDARILLFFTKRYAYHFFSEWPAYNGLSAITGSRMQIVIKDPSEDISLENPPPPLTTSTEIPEAIMDWPSDDDPRIPEDLQALLHLRNPELLNPDFVGGDCWVSGGQMIQPASVYVNVTPQYLKPLKLYTAVVNNLYNTDIREVHRYVFQTSRYADFPTQINSYQLDDGKGNQRDAIFQLEMPLTVADINLAYDIVTANNSVDNAALATTYADPFDRLIEGALKWKPLDAAISTEFNVVRNSTTNSVIAVWIRNPEPFNDPKLPDDVLARSLYVMNGLTPDLNYHILFSKDRSQAFVMHSSKYISSAQLKFRFAYIEWDGSDYIDHAIVLTGNIDMN